MVVCVCTLRLITDSFEDDFLSTKYISTKLTSYLSNVSTVYLHTEYPIYYIGLSPSFNAKILTLLLKNLVFSARNVYLSITFFS